jgi:hypothetical protein
VIGLSVLHEVVGGGRSGEEVTLSGFVEVCVGHYPTGAHRRCGTRGASLRASLFPLERL